MKAQLGSTTVCTARTGLLALVLLSTTVAASPTTCLGGAPSQIELGNETDWMHVEIYGGAGVDQDNVTTVIDDLPGSAWAYRVNITEQDETLFVHKDILTVEIEFIQHILAPHGEGFALFPLLANHFVQVNAEGQPNGTLVFSLFAEDNHGGHPDTLVNGSRILVEVQNERIVNYSIRLECVHSPASGQAICFGDGLFVGCPHGNDNDFSNGDAGCANSAHPGGANLFAVGNPKISADTVRLSVDGLPASTPGLFFQGSNRVNRGLGVPFGDGLRCVGGSIQRILLVVSNPIGQAMMPDPVTSGVLLSLNGGVIAGDCRRYQFWYRDVAAGGAGFNLTNAWEIVWTP